MLNRSGQTRVSKQKGSSVILVLLFLMVLSAAGMGMMYASNIDTLVGANYRQSLQAYYASKAGLEEARDRIRLAIPPLVPPTLMPAPGNPGSIVYIVNPDNNGPVQPWNTAANNLLFDDELCHENFAALGLPAQPPNIPCPKQAPAGGAIFVNSTDPNIGTANAVPYKWVRVTLKQNQTTQPYCPDGGCNNANVGKQVCADGNGNEILKPAAAGTCQAANMQPVYTITSMAMTSTGARRITQQEVANITVPPLPGALVLDGAGPGFSPATSANYGISGVNANSCKDNPPAANLPAIGTTTNNDIAAVSNAIPNQRVGNYPGADGTTPDVTNVSTTLGLYGTVGGLEQISAAITSVADIDVPAGQAGPASPWGTTANPLITVIEGDYSGPCNGAGILLVKGALTCNSGGGGYTWNGAILVIGKGYVTALNGGGNGQITGGMLVANIYDHQCANGDNSCNAQHLLPPASKPGAPYINWSGGGGNGIQFDACEIKIVDNKIGYHILVTREEMY